MLKQLLLLATVVVFGWALFSSFSPRPESLEVNARSRAVPSPAPENRAPVSDPTIANARPPVPLLLGGSAPAAPHPRVEAVGAAAVEPEKTDESDKTDEVEKRAAQVAAEMDGYKRVSILGKASNGAWRVKAYRGTTEVQLVVDGTGRVSTE